MFKKILFCILFILIFLIPSKQDSNAKTWERHNTTVYANSILAAIDRGDSISIDSCRIIDSLIIEGQWPKPHTEYIESRVDIIHTIFSDRVSFRGCRFFKLVSFVSDSFCQDVNFEDATFGGNAYFWNATFGGNADFSYATFGGNAYFWNATFGGNADFLYATFGGDANFSYATFGGNADFVYATFGGNAYFSYPTFGGDANFSYAIFGGNAYFDRTTFGGDAYFSDATFGGDACFRDAQFDKEVDLRLQAFKNIDISWKQLKDHLICDPPVAYKLMKQFEEKRMVDDADGIYLFMKDQERMEKKWYFRYPEYWFIQLTCGYGVKPQRTFIVSAVVIILFSVFYTKSNAIREIEKDLGHRRRRRKYRIVHKGFWKRFYDALYFSVHTFIIGIVSDWHPTDEFLIKTKKIRLFKFRTLSMIEGALGWVLLVLFVVTLTRKFIR